MKETAGSYMYINIRAIQLQIQKQQKSPLGISLAKHLRSIGAKIFGAFLCSHCLEQKQEPASVIQDKILFMINNISASNMDVKAKEFSDVLKKQYYPWFAQYMVMKRHGRMRSSQSFYKGRSSAWNAVLSSGMSNNNSNTLRELII
ncbi:uncharacterized protein LOC131244646 [Magnolia sinica]|uniref:uncharacterized protein LOC131244646 n=1 Tax=Magnolia sinica TaxID=86752 RepID=UPI002658CFC2|nr:uncharacterized protein LOC131244646 [Magnolia sinica]